MAVLTVNPTNNSMKIAVIMGGMSDEHEVSLHSGAQVIENLNKQRYEITPVIIQRTGGWLVDGLVLELPEALREMKTRQIEVAFLALHGPYGEDGKIQGLLEYIGIPYTGSCVLASSLAMDKVMTKRVFKASGIPVAMGMVMSREIFSSSASPIIMKDGVTYPCVVKPVHLGSSVAVAMVNSEEELQSAVKAVFETGDDALIEEFIAGDEVTCGVLDKDGTSIALMPTHIIPKTSAWFDYQAKYTQGGSEEVTPPNMPAQVIDHIREIALQCHKALGCRGVSRTDMIVRRNQTATNQAHLYAYENNTDIVVLETNTIPGMTVTSLLPQGAAAIGIDFSQLLDIIIANSQCTP